MENSEKIIAQVKKSLDIREGLIAGIQESIDMDAELPKEQEQNLKEWIKISAAQDHYESKLNDSKCRSAGDLDDQQSFRLLKRPATIVQKWVDDDDQHFRRAFSDHDHLLVKGKRKNLIELWLDEVVADRYIATHLYGGGIKELLDLQFSQQQIANLLEMSLTELDELQTASDEKLPQRLTNFEVYIALVKGYCVTLVLFLPGAFAMSGLLVGPSLLMVSAAITTVCVAELVEVAHHFNCYSYGVIADKVFGSRGRRALDVMIAVTQFAFTINLFAFIITSLKSSFDFLFGWDTSFNLLAGGCVCLLTPVAWVRNFSKFSFSYIAGNCLIIFIIILVAAHSLSQIYANGVANFHYVNYDGIAPMIGFVIYAYEGIGVVLPIMSQAEEPESFKRILVCAILSLTAIYVAFGGLCYLAYGDQTRIIITEMLPTTVFTSIVKILFCFNLVFSYSIIISPTNTIVEGWFFSEVKSKAGRRWSKNISRFLVCLLAGILSTRLTVNLAKFLGVLGALLCGPLALTVPAALHLKTLAVTTRAKMIDIALLILSAFVLVFCTLKSITD